MPWSNGSVRSQKDTRLTTLYHVTLQTVASLPGITLSLLVSGSFADHVDRFGTVFDAMHEFVDFLSIGVAFLSAQVGT